MGLIYLTRGGITNAGLYYEKVDGIIEERNAAQKAEEE